MKKLLSIIFISCLSPIYGAEDTIYVQYDSVVVDFFNKSSKKALDQGIVTKDLKVKQKAQLRLNQNWQNCIVRLKGDWTDHIKRDKWSLRVEMMDSEIFGMRKFSLQFPETRGGLKEKIFHDVLLSEGILTTAYRFVHLEINGQYWGKFALEEHPDVNLLKNNNQVIGPILKFDEEGFWQCQLEALKSGENKCVEYPIFVSARIKPFNKKEIFSNKNKTEEFLLGRKILEDWQNGEIAHSKIEIKKFAKYYALCDMFSMYHGLQWHNQRFYFNPKSSKLEPLAYDCFSKDNHLIGKKFLGLFDDHYDTVYFAEQWFNCQLFQIDSFKTSYFQFLKKYSQTNWDFTSYFSDEEKRKTFLKELNERKKEIVNFRKEDQLNPHFYSYFQWKKDNPNSVKKYKTNFSDIPFKNVSIRARKQGQKRILIKNYHLKSIHIVGYGTKLKQEVYFEPMQVLSDKSVLIADTKYNYVYFEVNEQIFKVKVELKDVEND